MVYKNGKPYFLMDDLGGKPTIFGNIHIYITNICMDILKTKRNIEIYHMQLPLGFCGPERLQWLGFYPMMTKTSMELAARIQEHHPKLLGGVGC